MLVYVSSTYEDLEPYRREVWKLILGMRYRPVCMEFMGARPVRPVVACLQDVARSDVYVGFLGGRYGYVDTAYPEGNGQSITELEYREAVKREIPTLVYVLDQPPGSAESAEATGRLEALREDWRANLVAPTFDTPQGLALLVAAGLHEVALERMGKTYEAARKATPQQNATKEAELDRVREEGREADRHRRESGVPVVGALRESLLDHFRDRVVQLHQLREHLTDPRLRVVMVWGRGGVGKTALVTKLVHELQWHLGDGEDAGPAESIVFLELRDTQYHRPDRIVEMIARTLGPDEGAELRARWQTKASVAEGLAYLFHEALADRRCLIVLDNLEDVLDDEHHVKEELGDLRQFIDAALDYDHRAIVLATSRHKMLPSKELEGRTRGRQREVSLDEGLPEDEAIELLRALDTDGKAGSTETPEAVLREIARRCEGNPRKLEVITCEVQKQPSLTFAGLLANEEKLTSLVGYPARELFRGLASDEERLVMQVLAVFNHPVPAAAVRYLLPGLLVDEMLDELTRTYAVSYDRQLFGLHPSDQQYAYSQIPETGEQYSREGLHQLASRYYDELEKPSDEWRTVEDLEPQLQRFYHLVRGGLFEAAALLLGSIDHSYLSKWGYANIVIDLRRELEGGLGDGRLAFENLSALGSAYLEVADLSKALPCLEKAERIAREADDLGWIQTALNNLGMAYGDVGQPGLAERCYRENLQIADDAGDSPRRAAALANMAVALNEAGRLAELVDLVEEALEIDRRYYTDREVGIDYGNLGFAKWMLGETEEAVRLHQQAYELAVSCGDRVREGIHKGNKARALMDMGEFEAAEGLFVDAVEINRRNYDGRRLTANLADLGRLLAWRGDDDQAAARIDEGLERANVIPYPRAQIRGNLASGSRRLIAGNAEEAGASFATAAELARQVGDRLHLCKALRGLSQAQHLCGQLPQAVATCAEGGGLDYPTDGFAIAVRQGLLALATGDSKSAAPLLERGLQLCQAQLDRTPRYFDARFHLMLAQLGLGLPAEALESCGQALETCRATGFLRLVMTDLELLGRVSKTVFGVREASDLLRAASD